jgi:hypothetical protein
LAGLPDTRRLLCFGIAAAITIAYFLFLLLPSFLPSPGFSQARACFAQARNAIRSLFFLSLFGDANFFGLRARGCCVGVRWGAACPF